MDLDPVTGQITSAWRSTERSIADAAHRLNKLAHSAEHWIAAQPGRLGSAAAQAGVESLGWVDTRIASTEPGHYYDTVIPLGTFQYLTPTALLDAIRHNPGSFPIPGDGPFELGKTVTLSFLGTRNPVIVDRIDTSNPERVSMLLRTRDGHFFKGTAEHIIFRQSGHRLSYEVIGNGPTRELSDRKKLNLAFGRYEWPRLVASSVVPLAKKLELQLERSARVPTPPKR